MVQLRSSATFTATNQGIEPTCYAHAAARVMLRCWRGFHHGARGPSLKTFIDLIVRAVNKALVQVKDVIKYFGCPADRSRDEAFATLVAGAELHDYYYLPKINVSAVDPNSLSACERFVYCTFEMLRHTFDKFCNKLKECPSRMVTAADLTSDSDDAKNKERVGHAVVIDQILSDGSLRMNNSWGTNYGDARGCFTIEGLRVLGDKVTTFHLKCDPTTEIHPTLKQRLQMRRCWSDMTLLSPADVTLLDDVEKKHVQCTSGGNTIYTKGTFKKTTPCIVKEIVAGSQGECNEIAFYPKHANSVSSYGYYPVFEDEGSILDLDATSVAIPCKYHVVMEAADGDLETLLPELCKAPDYATTVHRIVEGVLRAVHHLKSIDVAHNNINPSHILRVGDTWKLCSFGSAQWKDANKNDEDGCDVYAVGSLIKRLGVAEGPMFDLAELCLHADRTKRPSAEQALKSVQSTSWTTIVIVVVFVIGVLAVAYYLGVGRFLWRGAVMIGRWLTDS